MFEFASLQSAKCLNRSYTGKQAVVHLRTTAGGIHLIPKQPTSLTNYIWEIDLYRKSIFSIHLDQEFYQ
jgi:hypothetical protein